MAIRPTKFNLDGSVEVYHDERGHSGIVQLSDIQYAKKADGTDNTNFIVLECPIVGCNSASLHPISGGCNLEKIGELFQLKAEV